MIEFQLAGIDIKPDHRGKKWEFLTVAGTDDVQKTWGND
jgi:hypothetical protein